MVNIQHSCSIALLFFFFMTAVLCIACGLILPQNQELILVQVKKRALEPRERVLSTLKELLQIEREKRQIQGVCNPPTESVKMCVPVLGGTTSAITWQHSKHIPPLLQSP